MTSTISKFLIKTKSIIALILFAIIAIGGQESFIGYSQSIRSDNSNLSKTEDFTKIESLLKQSSFFDRMNNWRTKVLIVKVNENSNYRKLNYYHYNSVYQDSNLNTNQDSADRGFFNPASTIKVGIISLALEKLNTLKLPKESKYRAAGSTQWYSFDEDIKKILLLSDNQATNRIILFLGFDHINLSMRAKGLRYFEVNRLMLNQGTRVNSPAFELMFERKILKTLPQTVKNKYSCFEIRRVIGNCATATELADVLIRLIDSEAYPSGVGFSLREEDRLWAQKIMSKTPKELGFDREDTSCRFLHPLSKKIAKAPGKLLSKCGISLFTHSFIDTSFLTTNKGQKYYIIFAVTPPQNITKNQSIEFMNNVTEFLVNKLNNTK